MICHGVIFDLDGTLADTLQDITDSVNYGLQQLGRPSVTAAQVRRYVGDGLPMLCRRALGESHADQSDTMAAIVLEQYRLHDMDHTVLYDGMPELLDALVRRNITLAVYSNKPHSATERMVKTLCSRWPFVAIEGYRAEEFKKPDPRMALQIASLMKAPPHEVCMMGDSLPDIQTARAAGMVAVAVTWGFRDAGELQAAGPDYLINHPRELFNILGL